MAQKQPTYSELIKLAKQYGVGDNKFFISACARYAKLTETIEQMHAEVEKTGILISRINVKGDTNLEENPLLTQIAKCSDTANKTLSLMMDIINKLGQKPDESDAFDCR